MTARPGIIERAYEMARSGEFLHVGEIEISLAREDYLDVTAQLHSRTLRRDLRALCEAARRESETSSPNPTA